MSSIYSFIKHHRAASVPGAMVPGPGNMGVQSIPALASSRFPPCVSLLRTPMFPPHQPPLGIPTNFQMLFLHSRSQKSILEQAFPEVPPPIISSFCTPHGPGACHHFVSSSLSLESSMDRVANKSFRQVVPSVSGIQ